MVGCGRGLTKDNDTRRAVSTLLVLCPAELDHVLCGGMCDVDFSENGVTIVRQPSSYFLSGYDQHSQEEYQQNTTHRVEDHFQHGLWAETCPDDVCHSLNAFQ